MPMEGVIRSRNLEVELSLNALAEGEGIFSPHGGGIHENMV